MLRRFRRLLQVLGSLLLVRLPGRLIRILGRLLQSALLPVCAQRQKLVGSRAHCAGCKAAQRRHAPVLRNVRKRVLLRFFRRHAAQLIGFFVQPVVAQVAHDQLVAYRVCHFGKQLFAAFRGALQKRVCQKLPHGFRAFQIQQPFQAHFFKQRLPYTAGNTGRHRLPVGRAPVQRVRQGALGCAGAHQGRARPLADLCFSAQPKTQHHVIPAPGQVHNDVVAKARRFSPKARYAFLNVLGSLAADLFVHPAHHVLRAVRVNLFSPQRADQVGDIRRRFAHAAQYAVCIRPNGSQPPAVHDLPRGFQLRFAPPPVQIHVQRLQIVIRRFLSLRPQRVIIGLLLRVRGVLDQFFRFCRRPLVVRIGQHLFRVLHPRVHAPAFLRQPVKIAVRIHSGFVLVFVSCPFSFADFRIQSPFFSRRLFRIVGFLHFLFRQPVFRSVLQFILV